MTATSVPDGGIAHDAPASVGQRMLWLIEHYRGGQGRLNYPLLLRLRGAVDPGALRSALDRLVVRHEALRTTFARRRGLLTQLIHRPGPVAINVVPVTPASESALRQRVHEEIAVPIDPRSAPMRVTLWTLTPREHLLCLNAHHLVTDAWSCHVLVDELAALLRGEALPRQGWQYRHFVQWQRRKTSEARQEADRDYWRRQLDGARAPMLPLSASTSPSPHPGNRTRELDFGRETWEQVRRLARAEQTTPFTVLLSIYYAALHRECGEADLSVASPFANRARPEVMNTVGFFANLLVLRTDVEPGCTFLDLLRRARVTVSEALAHQGYTHFMPPTGNDAANARNIEDIIFQMLPELPPPITAGDLEIEVLPPMLASRFDLELCVLPRQGGLRALLQYSPGRIDDALADRLAAGCVEMMHRVAAGTDFTV